MFSRESVWLPDTLVWELKSDSSLSRIQSYSLVELPVLAKFSLFDFGLETDIPVFSVTDTALTWATIPVGISRAMIDFYNLKIAGTTAMLPKIPEMLIRGQWVKITFWASKIFPPLSHIATPIEGKITMIDENFPGFWLTLPESIVKEKMHEVGYVLSPPYKIVAYMKDVSMISSLEKKYARYHLQFDAKMLQELNQKIALLQNIFLSITLFFISILGIFFVFLLFSFFRERRDVFRIIYIFGLSSFRSRMLNIAEPFLLIFSGIILWAFISNFLVTWLVKLWNMELWERGISYILFPVQMSSIITISIFAVCILSFMVGVLEYIWRRKILMR
jgi:hypothetical protein